MDSDVISLQDNQRTTEIMGMNLLNLTNNEITSNNQF